MRGCFRAVLILVFAISAALVVFLLLSSRLPQDAPLARMYRTEADLTVLVKALEAYRNAHGAYPPAGPEGLRIATDFLSRKGNYLPGGPPNDGWGRPYRYAPHTAYEAAASEAIRRDGAFFAPETYQVYSAGADGDSGLEDAAKQRDNITSWDAAKSWRSRYHERNAAYMNLEKAVDAGKSVVGKGT